MVFGPVILRRLVLLAGPAVALGGPAGAVAQTAPFTPDTTRPARPTDPRPNADVTDAPTVGATPDTSPGASRSPETIGAGSASPIADRPQIAAATTAAIDNLRDDISREYLTGRMTVADFLRRAKADDVIVREIGRAELVGGPRWLDTQTCQVQVEISGPRLSRILQDIAASHREAPLNPDEVARVTADWRRRTFAATGSSTDFTHVAVARPRAMSAAWSSIREADRLRALSAARDDAVARVISSVRRVSLGRNTLGEALGVKDVHDEVSDWLAALPVTRVNYRRDLQIELTLAATPDTLFAVLRGAIARHPELDAPLTEAGWGRVHRELLERMEPAVGRGTASSEPAGPAGVGAVPPMVEPRHVPASVGTTDPGDPRMMNVRPAVEGVRIPLGTPRWVADQVIASGRAAAGSSKLKAARQAELSARSKLADAIEALPLTRTLSIGQAANKDARIREAVLRAVDRATVDKTDYYRGSDVQVDLKLELREVWEQLKALP